MNNWNVGRGLVSRRGASERGTDKSVPYIIRFNV